MSPHPTDCSLGWDPKHQGGGDPRNPVTCVAETCTATCSFGGVCSSTDTCSCNDHWGKNPDTSIYPAASKESKEVRPPQQPVIAGDKSVLLKVLAGLGTPPGKGDPCLERWPGIQCDLSGYVTGIDLMRKGLSGTIPADVSRLEYLRDLILNDNELASTIPPEIGKMRRLENFFAYKNHLSGSLPNTIGECSSLINLVAYGNSLSGTIPPEVGNLFVTLRYIDLSFNHLTGDLPDTIGRLTEVETMYLNHNELTGMIPKDLNRMVALKHLRLEENLFINTVMNVGPVEVYSDQTHRELTEQWTDRWNTGHHYPTGAAFDRWKKGRKMKREEEEAKLVAGHAKRVADEMERRKNPPAPPPKGGAPKQSHPFPTKFPDAKKAPMLATALNPPPGQLPEQVGGVPSSDGHR